jgi:hypothetical protein
MFTLDDSQEREIRNQKLESRRKTLGAIRLLTQTACIYSDF